MPVGLLVPEPVRGRRQTVLLHRALQKIHLPVFQVRGSDQLVHVQRQVRNVCNSVETSAREFRVGIHWELTRRQNNSGKRVGRIEKKVREVSEKNRALKSAVVPIFGTPLVAISGTNTKITTQFANQFRKRFSYSANFT